jgi:arylsulfatase A-like enzyme
MNILVIFSDQQHKYSLGRVDSQFITPHLDRLADDGVLFTDAYSNNPVCGPYRGCLMTGLYTSHCKVYQNCDPLPDFAPDMATVLAQKGWQTCFVGKWHLGGNGAGPIPKPLRGGFEHFVGYQCYNGFDPRPPYNNRVAFFDENDQEYVFDRHRTDVTTDLAVEKLTLLAQSDRPFLAVVGYQAPHYPEQPSDDYAALYKDVILRKTPEYQPVNPYTPTFSPYSPRPYDACPDYQRYGNDMDTYQQLYAGMVSQVDAGVGRIVQALKDLNLYEDTLIVYTSDHGDMQGSHGLKNKCYPHEKSAGVPFIVRMPGGRRGEVTDNLVSGVDVFATALEVAGIADSPRVDGRSFLRYMQGDEQPFNEYVISEYVLGDAPWRMIRTPRYKLVVSMVDYAPVSLHDMQNDPWEMNNQICCPEHQAIIRKLTEILRRYTAPVDDIQPPDPALYPTPSLTQTSSNS